MSDAATGDTESAVARLEEALSLYRTCGARSVIARICCECAEALLARGTRTDRERAGRYLREARSIARALGMKLLLERIRGLSLGSKGRKRSPRKRSPT